MNRSGLPHDGGFVVALIAIALVGSLGVWVTFFADCSAIGWVPVKDLPSRCLELHR